MPETVRTTQDVASPPAFIRHRRRASDDFLGSLVSTELAPERPVFSFSPAVLPPARRSASRKVPGGRPAARFQGSRTRQRGNGDGRVAAIAIDL
jgi:hypothetical protein